MSHFTNRFLPSLESLDARINMSTLVAAPAPDAGNQGWGVWELKAADADTSDAVRYRGFAIVDRSQATEEPKGGEGVLIGGPQVDTASHAYTITFGGC